jgi:hypothetical protein
LVTILRHQPHHLLSGGCLESHRALP